MPSTSSKINKIINSFPSIQFEIGSSFYYSPGDKKIYYNPLDKQVVEKLLHEIGHYLLDHKDYKKDLTLLEMECDAWEMAKSVAQRTNLSIENDIIQEHLDSYRDWIHSRSVCPNCQQNGVQDTTLSYRCIVCLTRWRVNEAKQCSLRRYKLPEPY